MPLVVKDRVKETTTTTGTGTVTLAGPAAGFQSFSVIGNGNTTYYAIVGGTEWEVGIGTYSTTGPTLTRDTVLESSNSGSLVNFSAGTKDVFVTYPAEKSISDGYGTLPVTNGGTGAVTFSSGYLLKGAGTGAITTSVVYDNGTNVGIGTTSPAVKLDVVNGDIRAYNGVLSSFGVAGTATLNLYQNSGNWRISNPGGYLQFYDITAAAERMRIDSSGNVGIGTSSPTSRLTITGGVTEIRDGNYLMLRPSGNGWDMRLQATGTQLDILSGGALGSPIMSLVNGGNVGIGTSSPQVRLDVNNGAAAATQWIRTGTGFAATLFLKPNGSGGGLQIQAESSETATIYNTLNSPLTFGTNNTERLRIAANGAIGLSGANYGTSGQVLTSNGSGSAPTWQAVSSKYELISTSTASAASTVDFTGLSNTYSEYIIVCRQFFTSANALVGIRTSTNNGTSYDSAANTYGWSQMNVNTGGTAGGWTGQGTEIACGYTGSGSEIDYMRIHLVNAGVATRPMFDVVVGLQQTSYGQTARTIGWRQATTAINAIRIFMSSGTITGTFYLYGVRT